MHIWKSVNFFSVKISLLLLVRPIKNRRKKLRKKYFALSRTHACTKWKQSSVEMNWWKVLRKFRPPLCTNPLIRWEIISDCCIVHAVATIANKKFSAHVNCCWPMWLSFQIVLDFSLEITRFSDALIVNKSPLP